MKVLKQLMSQDDMRRAERRMAIQIVEKTGLKDLMLVGIRSRGVPLALNLGAQIQETEGQSVPVGILDITLYRDDLTTIADNPVVKPSTFPEPINDKVIVLVDDVLYTGRTVRAALDALVDFGRPKKVLLAVLVERGHRELPIHHDVAGMTLPTDAYWVVKVKYPSTDNGEEEVLLMDNTPELEVEVEEPDYQEPATLE